MSIMSDITAWIPHPVYPFVGGPLDGQSRPVTIVETARGMVPLDFWQVTVPCDVSKRRPEKFMAPFDPNLEICTYRFVPDHGQINIGHYEWIEDHP